VFDSCSARYYAAQVLLGLEHVHKMSIIYRDMKLENVLLDAFGHCRLSDLGLAVVTKVKIKGYAGTPGYTAPEMIKNKLYGPAADIFSYGVMLYRMLCGSKPFKGKVDRDLDKAVIERKPQFPKEIFSKEAISLLTGLLQKRPENRLGCSDRGIEEIKEVRELTQKHAISDSKTRATRRGDRGASSDTAKTTAQISAHIEWRAVFLLCLFFQHPFFESIDCEFKHSIDDSAAAFSCFYLVAHSAHSPVVYCSVSPGGLLEAGYIDPPFTPNKFDVNAASLKDIGDFDRAKYKHVKLDDRFKQRIRNFEYCSAKALQDEMSDTLRQDLVIR
jgi:serine/threonine protein kinase